MKARVPTIAIAGVLIFLGCFVWPSQYRYDQLKLGPGISFPVRTSRFSGKSERLTVEGWVPTARKSAPQVPAASKLDIQSDWEDVPYVPPTASASDAASKPSKPRNR
jgi:hypothetical protein